MSDAEKRWESVKARSERNGLFCAGCWTMYFYGGEIDGLRFGCPKHSTAEELAIVHRDLTERARTPHPLLDKLPREGSR